MTQPWHVNRLFGCTWSLLRHYKETVTCLVLAVGSQSNSWVVEYVQKYYYVLIIAYVWLELKPSAAKPSFYATLSF